MEVYNNTMVVKKKKRKANACNKIINDIECSGKYYLSYENNAPVFTCDKCNEKNLTWKKFYDEYLQLFRKKENWDNDKDKVSCIIGFFCFKYKEKYNTNYTFVPSNMNPYSSKECRDAWSLLAAFDGDSHKVRKYIIWLFNSINKNTNIISFGYIKTQALINKYNLKNIKKGTFQRESKLPSLFTEWCIKNVPGVFDKYALETMNDLGALFNYYKSYLKDTNCDESLLVNEAEKQGLIKLDKLNIG